MYQHTSLFKYLLFLYIFLLGLQYAEAATFNPRNIGSMPARRQNAQCESAVPGVSQDAIIKDACNQNPQNSETVCYNQLVVYIQQSANNVCAHFYALYNDCLVLNNYNETACLDQKFGFLDCSSYTLQAYAVCGCYYSLPADLYTCANVELVVRPAATVVTSNLPTDSTLSILTGPVTTSGQSLLPLFPGPTIGSSLTSGSDMTTPVFTATPTFLPLTSMSNIIASPTVVKPLSSSTDVVNSTVSLVSISSAASAIGPTPSGVVVQTSRIGVCFSRRRAKILRAV